MTYKKKISELFLIKGGSPQVRIKVSKNTDARNYFFYDQNHLLQDISQSEIEDSAVEKTIKTEDTVEVAEENDLIISLISATSAKVSVQHQGYLISQNYVKLVPIDENIIDENYVIYLLNESHLVKKQLARQLQGSNFVKVTIAILKNLEIPMIPIEKQRQIGKWYMKTNRLNTLRQRVEMNQKRLADELIERGIINATL